MNEALARSPYLLQISVAAIAYPENPIKNAYFFLENLSIQNNCKPLHAVKCGVKLFNSASPEHTTLLSACLEFNGPSQKVLHIPASHHRMARI
jgi:hypothetical protein